MNTYRKGEEVAIEVMTLLGVKIIEVKEKEVRKGKNMRY